MGSGPPGKGHLPRKWIAGLRESSAIWLRHGRPPQQLLTDFPIQIFHCALHVRSCCIHIVRA